MPDYVTISIPGELAAEIDVVIKSKKRGYSSRAEFVKDAVRRLLDTLGQDLPRAEKEALRDVAAVHDLGKGQEKPA